MNQKPDSSQDTIQALTTLANHFRDERDWRQFHNAKDAAISLSLEAAEVLELVQWKQPGELPKVMAEKHEHLCDELADVLYWVLVLAADHDIDLPEAFRQKLLKSAQRYPIAKSRGQAKKYTEL